MEYPFIFNLKEFGKKNNKLSKFKCKTLKMYKSKTYQPAYHLKEIWFKIFK